MATVVTIRQLLESGVHFGHQTRRWNPKMKRHELVNHDGDAFHGMNQFLGAA